MFIYKYFIFVMKLNTVSTIQKINYAYVVIIHNQYHQEIVIT